MKKTTACLFLCVMSLACLGGAQEKDSPAPVATTTPASQQGAATSPLGATAPTARGGDASAGNQKEAPSGKAAVETADASSELAAIRAESRAFVEAFNQRDAKAVARLWTENGTYTDETGRTFRGREDIEQAYAEFFAENPDATIRIVISSLELLSDSAAIEDGRAELEPAPAGPPGISNYTAVHVKTDGKWLMASVRDTWSELPSAHRNVADLEWLIGTWTAEGHGARSEAVCRWVANKSFVERQYTTTHHDGTTLSGVQLIGWNPERGQVQSWNFSSDGGHAVGFWTPQQNGWSAEMHGVTGDGARTAATNILTRLDENAYAWQSVGRTLDGASIPDTDEIVLKRQTSAR